MPQRAIITLTTDFGHDDPYVASLKGVILSLNPQAVIVDVSHSVRPQQIEQGAFLLEMSLPYFPQDTIHVAVVDPGVGTERRAIGLRTPTAAFVGPDNGVLSAALPDDVRERAGDGGRARLPEDILGVALTDPRYHRQPVSDTFHGRDVFAPAAARLSLGVPLYEMGGTVDEIEVIPPFRAGRDAGGSLAGRVVHVDAFGNLITDVRGVDLASDRVMVDVCGHQVAGVRRSYAESEGLTAVVGGSGFLEIARSNGSAAAALGADIGEPVKVRELP